jgi:hypothetical protein
MLGSGVVGGGWLCGGRLGGSVLGMVGIGSEAIRTTGVGGVDTPWVTGETEEDCAYGGVGGMFCFGDGLS